LNTWLQLACAEMLLSVIMTTHRLQDGEIPPLILDDVESGTN